MQQFWKNIKVDRSTAHTGAGQASTIYTKAIDMRDAEGCVFLYFGSSDWEPVSGGPTCLGVYGCTSSGGTFIRMGSSTLVSITSGPGRNTLEGKSVVLDLYKPTKPWVKFGVQNTSAIYEGAFMIKYGLRKPGSSHNWDSTYVHSGSVASISPST